MVNSTAANKIEAGAKSLHAGVDMDLGAACYGNKLEEAVKAGLVTMEEVDTAVSRILRTKFLTGLFDNPYVDPKKAKQISHTAENRALAAEIARQGTILLKNDGMLPLNENLKKIAVIGPNADMCYNQLGDYTAPQNSDDVVTVLEGIKNAVSSSTEVIYAKGCAVRDTLSSDISEAVKAAEASDAVILVVGGSSARDFKTSYASTGAATTDNTNTVLDMDCGEGFDRSTLDLLGAQNELMEAILATGKPVACICGDGAFQMNIQELQWVKRENIPVKMIVMNNEALGMIRHLQRDYFDCVYADTSDGSGFSSCNFSDVAQAYKIPAKRIQGEDVEKYAGKFLEQNGPELLEIMLEHGTYAYPKTCLGEPIHNQQPYIPKPIFDELMEL